MNDFLYRKNNNVKHNSTTLTTRNMIVKFLTLNYFNSLNDRFSIIYNISDINLLSQIMIFFEN